LDLQINFNDAYSIFIFIKIDVILYQSFFIYSKAMMQSNTLSEDQSIILENVIEGSNVFATGPGGCGKSYVLKYIIQELRKQRKKVSICAMTGCAAVLLECKAQTLHSWAGIGTGKGDALKLASTINLNFYKRRNWLQTEVLILDEVSMLSKSLFETLDIIGKHIRKNAKPFGGIQLLFVGDFFQLPPVASQNDPDTSKFCFESSLWNETFEVEVLLDTMFRQTDDEYIKVLHQIRKGGISKKSMSLLSNRVQNPPDNIATPIRLFARKYQTDEYNQKNMDAIKGETYTFHAKSDFSETLNSSKKQPSTKEIEIEIKHVIQNNSFVSKLDLKIGCRVMCLINIRSEEEYNKTDILVCNGSTGNVINIENDYPTIRFDNGYIHTFIPHIYQSEKFPGVYVEQIPICQAYAITIHKCQGSTLDSAYIDLGDNIFAEGQSYVALSRVKCLDGLYLSKLNPNRIRANKKVVEYYTRFYE
jgi:ATP-dependent DNA helicase PIF1